MFRLIPLFMVFMININKHISNAHGTDNEILETLRNKIENTNGHLDIVYIIYKSQLNQNTHQQPLTTQDGYTTKSHEFSNPTSVPDAIYQDYTTHDRSRASEYGGIPTDKSSIESLGSTNQLNPVDFIKTSMSPHSTNTEALEDDATTYEHTIAGPMEEVSTAPTGYLELPSTVVDMINTDVTASVPANAILTGLTPENDDMTTSIPEEDSDVLRVNVTSLDFLRTLILYIHKIREDSDFDIKIAVIMNANNTSRVIYDSITDSTNRTDFCDILQIIHYQDNDDYLAESYITIPSLHQSLEVATDILSNSNSQQMVWVYLDGSVEEAESAIDALNNTLEEMRNGNLTIFLITTHSNVCESLDPFGLVGGLDFYQSIYDNTVDETNIVTASNSNCVNCLDTETCYCALHRDHLGYICQGSETTSNSEEYTSVQLDTIEITTPYSYEQTTETPTVIAPYTPAETNAMPTTQPVTSSLVMGPTAVVTTTYSVSDHGPPLETRDSNYDIETSTETSHFTSEMTRIIPESENTDDEKPFYERTYFVVIAVTISSVVAVLLLCLYCFVVAICWKSKKHHKMHIYTDDSLTTTEDSDPLYSGYAVPVPRSVTSDGSLRSGQSERRKSLFESDLLTSENHVDMPGWDQYLTKQAQEHNITHLSVSCFHPKRGAWTSGYVISERQVRHLERLFKGKVKSKVNAIHFARNEYKLDKRGNKFGTDVMHAARDVEEETEHVWITFGSGYVVVGVSELDDGASDRCLNCVLNIRMHIIHSAPEHSNDDDGNGNYAHFIANSNHNDDVIMRHSNYGKSMKNADKKTKKRKSRENPGNSSTTSTMQSMAKRLASISETDVELPVITKTGNTETEVELPAKMAADVAKERRPSAAADAYIAQWRKEQPIGGWNEGVGGKRHSVNY